MTIKDLIARLSVYPEDMRAFIADDVYSREIKPNTPFVKYKAGASEWAKINKIGIDEEVLEIRINEYE